MKNILGETFYNLAEIAQKLKVKPHVIRGYIKSNRLQGQRIGQSLYISAQSLQKFLKPDASVDHHPELTERVRSFLNRYRKKDAESLEPPNSHPFSIGGMGFWSGTGQHCRTRYRSGKKSRLCRRE
ncbi:helix-turn-helix domain-containing protein [Neolewinella persica]|uniref:helix-turn-helix domain-containing protein n=1 Tax=Neolewinella persica TaxID=70998 RepID=UPI000475F2D0